MCQMEARKCTSLVKRKGLLSHGVTKTRSESRFYFSWHGTLHLMITFTCIDTLISDGSVHVLVWAMKPISYARHRFPPDVIRHAVWLYLRFTLSYRDVEDLLAERGLTVSNESIRRWVLKFGPIMARNLLKFTRE